MGISFDIFFNDWCLIIPANSNLKCPNSPQANGGEFGHIQYISGMKNEGHVPNENNAIISFL